MFRRWSVTNFKSIGRTQSLDLFPLTVVAGANNSGKSSFLQSILIVAQTMRSARAGPALLLDGDLFKGGDAQELTHIGQSTFSFGFVAGMNGDGSIGVEAEFSVGSGAGSPEKEFQLERCRLNVESSGGESPESLEVERRKRPWRGLVGSGPPAWVPEGLRYKPGSAETRPGEVLGVSLLHFLPQWGIVRRDARTERFTQVIRYLTVGEFVAPQDETIAREAVEVAQILLKDPSIGRVRDLGPGRRRALRAFMGRDAPKGVQHIFQDLEGEYRWRQRPLPPLLETAVGSLRGLAGSVRHLGPLRLPPQFVYAPAPRVEEGAVGSGGEFTVAELHRRGATQVLCPDPESGEVVTMPLRGAVELWLNHLGVLERIWTAHRPKLGHYMYVRAPHLTKVVDLTAVGVGASQILPVVVQCLAAPPGSVLIFEQPELHLHPKVQSALGDFLLGIARSGRQCIVETHSEHIINRLRLRIAEAEGEGVLSLARIYFAEREGVETQFTPVTINEYGAIEHWPEGFFDESVVEAERILRSSVRKRSPSD
jgi:hypothetical protein